MSIALTQPEGRSLRTKVAAFLKHNPTVSIGLGILLTMLLIAILAPWLGTVDPAALAPAQRGKFPSQQHWFGTDVLGRDLYSRVLYGARVSLIVGFSVAVIASSIGLAIGLASGYWRRIDAVLTPFLDALMAIPSVLLAIALTALSRPSLTNVIIAITVAEVPRVVRLTRGVVLSLRDQVYIDAAITGGTNSFDIIVRHILPNTIAPLLIQATYIFAAAMLVEAVLSFIGAGTPLSNPSWGNIMSQGRALFQLNPLLVLIPAIFMSVTILAANLTGDGLRDALDPRLSKEL